MTNRVDISDYIFSEKSGVKVHEHRRHRMRHQGRFMCMQESWAIKAFKLARELQTPGPVIVGLIIWQKFWMEHAKQPLKVTNPMLYRFGIKRSFFAKWLGPMEKAGLIQVQRFMNRSPLITIMLTGTGRDHGIE